MNHKTNAPVPVITINLTDLARVQGGDGFVVDSKGNAVKMPLQRDKNGSVFD